MTKGESWAGGCISMSMLTAFSWLMIDGYNLALIVNVSLGALWWSMMLGRMWGESRAAASPMRKSEAALSEAVVQAVRTGAPVEARLPNGARVTLSWRES